MENDVDYYDDDDDDLPSLVVSQPIGINFVSPVIAVAMRMTRGTAWQGGEEQGGLRPSGRGPYEDGRFSDARGRETREGLVGDDPVARGRTGALLACTMELTAAVAPAKKITMLKP